MKNAFRAADLDGNGYCSLEEFLTLWKYINSDTFDEENVVKIFHEEADEEKGGEVCMSFDRFAMVSSKNRLFTEVKQMEFIGAASGEELIKKYSSLKSEWSDKNLRMISLVETVKRQSNLDQGEIQGWIGVINQIDSEIKGERYVNSPVLLISIKMLELEI